LWTPRPRSHPNVLSTLVEMHLDALGSRLDAYN